MQVEAGASCRSRGAFAALDQLSGASHYTATPQGHNSEAFGGMEGMQPLSVAAEDPDAQALLSLYNKAAIQAKAAQDHHDIGLNLRHVAANRMEAAHAVSPQSCSWEWQNAAHCERP